MIKKLLVSACAVLTLCCCGQKTEIINLQTEYMSNPIGIDIAQPRFSWALDSKDYNVVQISYHITVTDEDGTLVYDTGEVETDYSIGIKYKGEPLKPCTRYQWTLSVKDNKGRESTSSASFETGLMSSTDRTVWDGAQWIGSEHPHLSKYRSTFDIDYTLYNPEGSTHSSVIFGYRDVFDFSMIDFDFSSYPARMTVSHFEDGIFGEDDNIDMYFIHNWNKYGEHKVKLEVEALDYALGYNVDVTFDEKKVNSRPIVIKQYPQGVWMPYSRLYSIGFQQEEGSPATISDVIISENVWGSTLYEKKDIIELEGGDKVIWSPAEEFSAPMIRKDINIDKKLKSARLYTTARGIYEYYINGRRLTSDRFNPGSSDYRYRILYNTYDITEYMVEGNNAICAQLGAGWWSDFTGYATRWQDQFGTQLSLLAKIVLTYNDGSRDVIVSDPSWKVFDQGPITSDSFQNGEDYDARREIGDWSNPKYDVSYWKPSTVYEAPADSIEISWYMGNPVSNNITLKAVSVTEPEDGVFVYDMGQNMVGVPRIKLKGKKGQEISLRYGEMIYPEEPPTEPLDSLSIPTYIERKGRVYNENYRGALSTDHYIMRGDEEGETIEPHFTFHGYRYIEIHGLEKALPLDAVEGVVLESIGKQLSSFETSDTNINKLYNNIVWGQRGNFLSIPTDCPQRDERMGWTGDAQIFARSASYNMNVNQFYNRYIQSLRDAQGENGNYCDFIPKVGTPAKGSSRGGGNLGWADVGIILPWQVFQQYGDFQFIEDHYDSMKKYIEYLESRSIKDIQPGSGYGDWCAIEHTTSTLTNTCYYAYDVSLMEKMASLLGKKEDANYYKDLYDRIKDAFNNEFVDEEGCTKECNCLPPHEEWIAGGSDSEFIANTQTSYVLPLYTGLFNDTNKPLAIKHLTENIKEHGYKLTTGFIGTPYLNLVLSDNGHKDIAYKLFEQTEYPSWLYPVLQGATTIWERWNSYTIKNGFGPVDMNSFNHYSYGAVEEWMIKYALGIARSDEHPGYGKFFLRPQVGGTLKFCKGHYDSILGRIESGWTKTDKGYIYECKVPANTSAILQLEVNANQKINFTEGGNYAKQSEDGSYILGSGSYKIIVE